MTWAFKYIHTKTNNKRPLTKITLLQLDWNLQTYKDQLTLNVQNNVIAIISTKSQVSSKRNNIKKKFIYMNNIINFAVIRKT